MLTGNGRHWQLRHYISQPEPDHLYYASGNDVYCLHTSTKKRKHIATLPFEARCTASGHGWVCVGGEDEGHFAAIKIDGTGPRSTEVDDRLDVGTAWNTSSNSSPGRRAASVKIERIGEEIVNSISIHRIQEEDAHLDDIVAVLTNNDKTVRVYSLPQSLETCVLDLPFAMNHATVSPDGTMMVAVGDVNQAYFFSREIRGTPPQIPKPHNRLTSGSIDWNLTNVVNLHVSAAEATMGYFTTAWSPSGRLVAVGSEGGYITVLDVDVLADPELEDEDAVVAVLPGSRPDVPQPHPGAVRSMVFSPDPWDLLVWAEDQGRICVGDLRTGLKSKQVVSLDPKEEGLRRETFEDLPEAGPTHSLASRNDDQLEDDFMRRYRNAHDNASAVNFAQEYIEARRRHRTHRQGLATARDQNSGSTSPSTRRAMDDDPGGLTASEQDRLNALRTSRQREESRAQGGPARGVNYTTPDMFAASGYRSSTQSPGAEDSSRPPRTVTDALRAAEATFPELSRSTANAHPNPPGSGTSSPRLPPIQVPGDAGTWGAGHTNTTGNTTGLVRLSDGSRLPRRRQSVILSPPTTTASSSSPARPSDSTARDDSPWRTIEDAMTLARGPLFESAARVPPRAELSTELANERQRQRWRALVSDPSANATGANATALPLPPTDVRRLAGFPDGYETVLRRIRVGGITGRELGVRTAGLAMSEDGRTIWAACEEGIFEIEVKRKTRMFWPSVEPL